MVIRPSDSFRAVGEASWPRPITGKSTCRVQMDSTGQVTAGKRHVVLVLYMCSGTITPSADKATPQVH